MDTKTLIGNIGKTLPFEGYNHRGYLVRKVLPELIGKSFDEKGKACKMFEKVIIST